MFQDYSGERLRTLRKRARLTQSQVVKLAGVSEAALCYLERGKRKPHSRTLEKLLNVYAIRIQYWKNIEKTFEENNHGGNISGETVVRTGSTGIPPA